MSGRKKKPDKIHLTIRSIMYGTLSIGGLAVFIPWVLLKIENYWKMSWESTLILKIIAIPVGFVGFCLSISCVYYFFMKGSGTPTPIDEPEHLVTSGPYSFSRNPMQSGNMLILAGITLYSCSPFVLGYLILYWIFFHLFALYYEEPHLEKKYGKEYLKYKKQVNRWFPGVF